MMAVVKVDRFNNFYIMKLETPITRQFICQNSKVSWPPITSFIHCDVSMELETRVKQQIARQIAKVSRFPITSTPARLQTHINDLIMMSSSHITEKIVIILKNQLLINYNTDLSKV